MQSTYDSGSEKEGEREGTLLVNKRKIKELRNWIEQICREPVRMLKYEFIYRNTIITEILVFIRRCWRVSAR